MPQKGKIEKALKPSERKSITEFSTRFGTGPTYEERVRTKKIASIVLLVTGILLLICVGYFITDVLIKITEMPYQNIPAVINSLKETIYGLYTL
jgi:hypothetical protein